MEVTVELWLKRALNFCSWINNLSLFRASNYLYIYVSTFKSPTYIHRKWNSQSPLQVITWPLSPEEKRPERLLPSLKDRGCYAFTSLYAFVEWCIRQLCHFIYQQTTETNTCKNSSDTSKPDQLICKQQYTDVPCRTAAVLSRSDGESETCQRAHSEWRCFMSRVEVSRDPHPASCLVGSKNGQCQGTFCYSLCSLYNSIKSSPIFTTDTSELFKDKQRNPFGCLTLDNCYCLTVNFK